MLNSHVGPGLYGFEEGIKFRASATLFSIDSKPDKMKHRSKLTPWPEATVPLFFVHMLRELNYGTIISFRVNIFLFNLYLEMRQDDGTAFLDRLHLATRYI